MINEMKLTNWQTSEKEGAQIRAAIDLLNTGPEQEAAIQLLIDTAYSMGEFDEAEKNNEDY